MLADTVDDVANAALAKLALVTEASIVAERMKPAIG